MAKPVHNPPGAWPCEMRAETAAAFCDEPSVPSFLAKVGRGIYSAPLRVAGALPKWHRAKLERDIAQRHGLAIELAPLIENIENLI